jgi:hypothetical protein
LGGHALQNRWPRKRLQVCSARWAFLWPNDAGRIGTPAPVRKDPSTRQRPLDHGNTKHIEDIDVKAPSDVGRTALRHGIKPGMVPLSSRWAGTGMTRLNVQAQRAIAALRGRVHQVEGGGK